MKILVAVDGSAHTQRLIDFIASHKTWGHEENQFTFLTVTPHLPGRAAAMFNHDTLAAHYRDEAQAVLGPLGEQLKKLSVKTNLKSRIGSPAHEIALEASEGGYDLVMAGSHGHGALGVMLGSVSNQLLAQSKVPVLVVR